MAGRFVGYLNRRPYLWFVDLEERAITPAATGLQRIPQGISELIPVRDAVAVRCGPTWFELDADLGGPSRSMDDDAITEALTRSVQINVLAYNWGKPCEAWVLPLPGSPLGQIRLPEVRQLAYAATVSPDGQTVAVAVSFTPPPPPKPLFEAQGQPLSRDPWTVALVDVSSGTRRFCTGDFDRSPYPPAWRADAKSVAVGPPYEPRNVYEVDIETGALRRTEFRRHAPSPLLDAEFLGLR